MLSPIDLRGLGGRIIVGKLLFALLVSRDLHFPALGLQKSDFLVFMIKVTFVHDSASDGLNVSLWRSSGSPGLQNVAFPNGIPTVLRTSLHAKIDFCTIPQKIEHFRSLVLQKLGCWIFWRQSLIFTVSSELK